MTLTTILATLAHKPASGPAPLRVDIRCACCGVSEVEADERHWQLACERHHACSRCFLARDAAPECPHGYRK